MLRTLCLTFLVLCLAACSNDDGGATGPQETSFAGVYSLISVDGDPIPILIFEDANEKSECTGGTLTLTDGADAYSGTFALKFLFRSYIPFGTSPRMQAVDRMLDPLKARIAGKDHYNE